MNRGYLLPHITEKSQALIKNNQYVFKVVGDLTKPEIKEMIEKKYKVHVESVKIINVKPKKRRLGRFFGQKKGFKKAIVKLKAGEKIDIFPL
jgi:large subunit ribosomal protein L23